jgi:predicted GIY-YIG superfamily endonuclease
MAYSVYLLTSEEGYHYTGHTPDLERRLTELLIPSENCPEFRGRLPTRLVRFRDVLHAKALAIDKERIAVMQ